MQLSHGESNVGLIDDMLERFQQNFDHAQQIAGQNGRHDELMSDAAFDSHPEFREVAHEGIVLEQQDTLDGLAALDSDAYEAVSRDYHAALQDKMAAEERLAGLTPADDACAHEIRAVAARALELSPRAAEPLRSLEQQLVAGNMGMTREELQARIRDAGAAADRLEPLMESAGRAWPVPRVLYGMAEPEDGVVIVDEIPIVPPEYEMGETAKRIINRHGRNARAAAMATEVLIDNAGAILTPDEIGEAIYLDERHFDGMDDAETAVCKRYRVNNILNRKKTRVRDFLDEEGYVLQYGNRHFLDVETGKHVVKSRRIYRAVRQGPTVDPNAPDFEETILVDAADTNQINELQAHDYREEQQTARRQEIKDAIDQLQGKGYLPEGDKKILPCFLRHRVISTSRGMTHEDPLIWRLSTGIDRLPADRSLTATDVVLLAIPKTHQEQRDHSAVRNLEREVGRVLRNMRAESDDADNDLSSEAAS